MEQCDPEKSLSDKDCGLATKGRGKAKANTKAKAKTTTNANTTKKTTARADKTAKAKAKATMEEIAVGTGSAEAEVSGGADAEDPVAAKVGEPQPSPKAKGGKTKTQAQATATKAGAGTPKAKPQKPKGSSAPGGAAYETKTAYCKERNLLLRLASDKYKPRRGGPLETAGGQLSEKQLFFQSCLQKLTAQKGGLPRDHFREAAQLWRDECQAQSVALEAQAARDASLLTLSDAGSPGAGADCSGVTAAPCGANSGTAWDKAAFAEPAPGGQPDTEQPGCASPMAGAANTDTDTAGRGLALRSQKRTRKSCKGPRPECGQAALPEPQSQGQAGHDQVGSGNALKDPKQQGSQSQPAPVIMAAASASDEAMTFDDLDDGEDVD